MISASTNEPDNFFKYLLCTLLVICLIGLVMVYSSSFIYAKEIFGSSAHYLVKQVFALGIGAVMLLFMYRTKASFWCKYGAAINALGLGLLALTFVPQLGISIKGAQRWLDIGLFSFQPGEFVKYTLLIASISYFEQFFDYSKIERFIYGLLLLTPLALLLIQPDFGGFLICLIIIGLVAYFSHFPRRHFYQLVFAAFLAVIPILVASPYRVKRLFTYLDPWKNPQTSGFQIIQSYLAFANGSVFGQGLGNSNEKLFYLPEAHNDFIFSVIGEELGFVGVIALIALFFLVLYLGLKIAVGMIDPSVLYLGGGVGFHHHLAGLSQYGDCFRFAAHQRSKSPLYQCRRLILGGQCFCRGADRFCCQGQWRKRDF